MITVLHFFYPFEALVLPKNHINVLELYLKSYEVKKMQTW